MGLIQSKEHHKTKKHQPQPQPQRPINRARECSNNSIQNVSSMTSTPNLSRSSSTINSRATSVMGDVKDCMHKMLGRPSDLPINNSRLAPRRSFSAPAELFTIDDQPRNQCPSEEEQDRLTNTVMNFMGFIHGFFVNALYIAFCSEALFWR